MLAGHGISDLELTEQELEHTKERIIRFIRKSVVDAGVEGAVIGLSGGIDSTLTAYLAVEALGLGSVYGVVMPSKVNKKENMKDAVQVANDIEMEHSVIEIESIVEEFESTIEKWRMKEGMGEVEDRVIGNLRGRVRAVILYRIANASNSMVIGTGNRTEALIGYFTKYGDGAVDCHPIGNLYKCQVRQLAEWVGVPSKYITKAPTAGLWEGQTDEKELGMGYDVLDLILYLLIEQKMSVGEIQKLLEIDEKNVLEVQKMYELSEHKRNIPPSP